MATRKLILGSAASLILMSAAPVLAQSSDPAQTYSNAKAQYESDLQAYNQKQQAYERERSEYDAKIADYQRSLNTPAPAPNVVIAGPKPDVVIYLQAPTEVLLKRIRTRGRPEESRLGEDYLAEVNRAYNQGNRPMSASAANTTRKSPIISALWMRRWPSSVTLVPMSWS